jgi:hypothetical protein
MMRIEEIMLPNCTKSKTAEDAIGHGNATFRSLTEALGNVYNKGTGFSTWFPG